MTRLRLLFSAIIVPAILALIWLDFEMGQADWLGRPGVVLFVCALLTGLVAAGEVLYFRPAGTTDRLRPWAVYGGTALVICLAFIPLLDKSYPDNCAVGRLGWLAFGMAAAIGLAFVSQFPGYRQGDQVLAPIAITVLMIGYVGLLISFWSPLRGQINNEWGMVALLSLFVPVKLSDSLAYTFGRLWGKRKLSPQLSPGKTIEGLGGGIAGGVLGAAIVFWLVAPWMTGERTAAPWWLVLVFGVVVTLAGVLGDLAESMMKREAGIKNSSRWLPGLGGITDMIDSLLAAGPVVLAFWVTGLFGPSPS